jgi:hypothetical protein
MVNNGTTTIMDLKPNNYESRAFFGLRGQLRDTEVTFDTFEEWNDFASGLPLLHPQHFRLAVTRIREQAPYPLPIRSYEPESFPRMVRLDNSTLGAFVGNLALKDVSDHPNEWYKEKVERQKAITAQITNYLGLIPAVERLAEA